jgi:hypothetical protein
MIDQKIPVAKRARRESLGNRKNCRDIFIDRYPLAFSKYFIGNLAREIQCLRKTFPMPQ